MGLFDLFKGKKKQSNTAPAMPTQPGRPVAVVGQKHWREIALKSPSQPKRREAVQKLEDQQALEIVAKSDEDQYVRADAIRKLRSTDAILACALRDRAKDNRQAAVQRFSEVSWPEALIPGLLKLTDDRQQVGKAVALLTPNSPAALMNLDPLKAALASTEDAELIQAVIPPYAYGLIDEEKRRRQKVTDLCNARLREVEKLLAGREAKALDTDEARAAFARDDSRPAEPRAKLVEQMSDDALLSELALDDNLPTSVRAAAVRRMKSPDDALLAEVIESDSQEAGLAAAERMADSERLASIAKGLDNLNLWNIYPVLMNRCEAYTPEYVLFDVRAQSQTREKALESVDDDAVLARFAKSGAADYSGQLTKKAIAKICDRELLGEIARDPLASNPSGKREHLRWCAAWRAGDGVMLTKIEQSVQAERINGHATIPEPDDTYRHKVRCIRCDRVGWSDDMRKNPCRPDFPRL